MIKFELPPLDYEMDALEPNISKETVDVHHNKHHNTYKDNLNKILEQVEDKVKNLSIEEIIADVNNLIPEEHRQGVINQGGGYLNHNIYFDILGPKNHKPEGELLKAIEKDFGSLDKLKDEMTKAATGVFGSGWAWLVVENGTLQVITTANQDSPYTMGKTPILPLDVWEHAYYIDYQNKRPDYIEKFFNVVDWEKVAKRFEEAK